MRLATYVLIWWLSWNAIMLALALAHPGGLASDGCHVNKATGERHCHRKVEPAPICPDEGGLHYEPDGTCWSRFVWDERCCNLTSPDPPPTSGWVPLGDVLHWSESEDTPEMCATVIPLSYCKDFAEVPPVNGAEE